MLPLSTLVLYSRSMAQKKPKPYHHGNLREELLKAALILIAKVGPMAFTLREVALCLIKSSRLHYEEHSCPRFSRLST